MTEQQAPRKSGSGWPKRILGIVVVIAIVVGLRFYNKGSDSAEARDALAGWVQAMPSYAENGPYLNRLLNDAHEYAFDKTYTMGGRRRSAEFDADRYALLVFTRMAEQAQLAEKMEIAAELRALALNYRAAPTEEGN